MYESYIPSQLSQIHRLESRIPVDRPPSFRIESLIPTASTVWEQLDSLLPTPLLDERLIESLFPQGAAKADSITPSRVTDRPTRIARVAHAFASNDAVAASRAYPSLLRLGMGGRVDTILPYLYHPAAEVRAQVARACGELGAKGATPLLLSAADDGAPHVRACVADSIGRMRAGAGISTLVRLLADEDDRVAVAAIGALRRFAPRELAPVYERFVGAYEWGGSLLRARVVEIASRFDRPETLALLQRAVEDTCADVRQVAASALREWYDASPSPAATDSLRPCLDV